MNSKVGPYRNERSKYLDKTASLQVKVGFLSQLFYSSRLLVVGAFDGLLKIMHDKSQIDSG